MITYRTKDGDILDDVVFRYYGTTQGTVEKVLEANQNLADIGPIFPVGIEIELPEIKGPMAEQPVRLWD